MTDAERFTVDQEQQDNTYLLKFHEQAMEQRFRAITVEIPVDVTETSSEEDKQNGFSLAEVKMPEFIIRGDTSPKRLRHLISRIEGVLCDMGHDPRYYRVRKMTTNMY